MTLDADLNRVAGRVIKHMNDDHASSNRAFSRFYAGLPATSAVMVGLDARGFVLDVSTAGGGVERGVLIPFDSPLAAASDVRKAAVRMHFAAFHGLGARYKLANGYYSGAARQVWAHIPATAFRNVVVAVAVGFAASYALRPTK